MLHINEGKAKTLFNEYKEYVYRTALFLTKSRILADDITQETFIRVYTKYQTYDHNRPIKPWIYTITINVTRSIMKKQRWLEHFSPFTENVSEDLINSVEELFLKNEELKDLWDVVSQLSLKSREVIILHYYLDFTLRESSEILNIPIGTCKSRINTALNQLRRSNINSGPHKKGGEIF
ncbi:RNA polymerase sigma factor [Rossellomorea yichunensis]|uniref:RNA polymerase sigma factor n=1 Tax=Rossellomorea yichunensis TaxID=3077331 RepID=UPI0028DEEA68|nr:RNA polymerase sigma factor [Rossellomorea sp. YC4-1]MDT9027521.1 RNA polymerase sigma factor [Rossellomorea sp. YC4-1]